MLLLIVVGREPAFSLGTAEHLFVLVGFSKRLA